MKFLQWVYLLYLYWVGSVDKNNNKRLASTWSFKFELITTLVLLRVRVWFFDWKGISGGLKVRHFYFFFTNSQFLVRQSSTWYHHNIVSWLNWINTVLFFWSAHSYVATLLLVSFYLSNKKKFFFQVKIDHSRISLTLRVWFNICLESSPIPLRLFGLKTFLLKEVSL